MSTHTPAAAPAVRTHTPAAADDMKSVLSGFCTGIAVITACGSDGRPVGMAVQSFSSVSLDPPLVCFCPARTSTTWPGIRAAGAFAVNVLAADQLELCRRFAVTGGDKFAGVAWRAGAAGAPLLDGVLATVECVLEDVLDGGDHAIALGRVTAAGVHRDGAPLLYFRRAYGRVPDSGAGASASISASMAAARSRSEA
ncbi:flavin reductase family protein [Streptomyces sp. SPB4]|uniref:flavin reductase family protein n=1 Tax=Streptomyces sp. SPB4 TaxID=2940553 RepID=UPI002475C2D0|nr:flavin reductase family protein [Streptomyces sp. SPB4]MDH6538970.1 3-hydroxy-9,10-secoandrosta-1,3,5(10)-triene-9,17-dione monooxygenase reductase component [Streptomyces sp. SPB4]